MSSNATADRFEPFWPTAVLITPFLCGVLAAMSPAALELSIVLLLFSAPIILLVWCLFSYFGVKYRCWRRVFSRFLFPILIAGMIYMPSILADPLFFGGVYMGFLPLYLHYKGDVEKLPEDGHRQRLYDRGSVFFWSYVIIYDETDGIAKPDGADQKILRLLEYVVYTDCNRNSLHLIEHWYFCVSRDFSS
jgi:hypothetical protein